MQPSSHSPINLGPITVTFSVVAEQSNGTITVQRCDVRASAGVPLAHSHDAFEETIHGLEGVTTFTIDGQSRHRPRRHGLHPARRGPQLHRARQRRVVPRDRDSGRLRTELLPRAPGPRPRRRRQPAEPGRHRRGHATARAHALDAARELEPAITRAQVHLAHGVAHEPRQVLRGQPLPHARRQQQLLLAITRDDVLAMPECSEPSRRDPTLYATASMQLDSLVVEWRGRSHAAPIPATSTPRCRPRECWFARLGARGAADASEEQPRGEWIRCRPSWSY